MQHNIDTSKGDSRTPEMANAIESCVHCGFCLAACPTYTVLGEEMDSPRGRIYLMKNVLEENLEAAEAQPYIDRCLGCMACVTACPSGVAYGDLIVSYRAAQKSHSRPPLDVLTHTLICETLPYPGRFRLAAQTGKIGKLVEGVLPDSLATMLRLLPDTLPPSKPLPEIVPAKGQRRGRVALLAGCVQQVLAPEINWAAVQVLAENGIETVIPKAQNCCGSILLHVGEDERALKLARNNLTAFPNDVDAIIITAAGCGSGIKEYGLLFKGFPEETQARQLSNKAQDISTYLAMLDLVPPPALKKPLKVAYQDACHLLHGQGIHDAPRHLLAQIPNLDIVNIDEPGMCCGSAGTYNIEQPEIARELGERKVRNILESSADVVVSGNIGCITQIRNHLAQQEKSLPVLHLAQLLDYAYHQDHELV